MSRMVLFIDDDRITNSINARIVKKAQFDGEVKFVLNGLEGLKYIKECIASESSLPTLIFLDINMPIMNGWEFLETYKDLAIDQSLDDLPKVVMLSTSSNPDDELRSTNYEFVEGYINKPLTTEAFNKFLNI